MSVIIFLRESRQSTTSSRASSRYFAIWSLPPPCGHRAAAWAAAGAGAGGGAGAVAGAEAVLMVVVVVVRMVVTVR